MQAGVPPAANCLSALPELLATHPALLPRTPPPPHPRPHPPPQAANPGLTLSYTLPVLPAGLTADGVALLVNARARGVRLDVLNIMTMDYGDSAAPGE